MMPDPISHDWLDPVTRSILQPSHPIVDAGIAVAGYSLLLIKGGQDQGRTSKFIATIQANHAPNQTNITNVVCQQLSLDEAFAAQFMLSCSDCISAFVADEIVFDDNAPYLAQLSSSVQESTEFELINVSIQSLPATSLGRQFAWQFFGMAIGNKTPLNAQVFRKKARLMRHWAGKCGVRFESPRLEAAEIRDRTGECG